MYDYVILGVFKLYEFSQTAAVQSVIDDRRRRNRTEAVRTRLTNLKAPQNFLNFYFV